MSDEVRIGASGFAECAMVYPKITHAKLRPFKFKKKGEGAGRSGYYKPALDAIREFHSLNNDRSVFQQVRQELGSLYNSLAPKTDITKRIRISKNIDALHAYERIYGNRKFKMLPRHHLSVPIGDITVTAQPDLWVSENGIELLIKIGAAKKNPQQIDILVYLLRKAAVSSGYKIRARNVIYLDISNGEERFCAGNLIRFNKMFLSVASGITAVWPEIVP